MKNKVIKLFLGAVATIILGLLRLNNVRQSIDEGARLY